MGNIPNKVDAIINKNYAVYHSTVSKELAEALTENFKKYHDSPDVMPLVCGRMMSDIYTKLGDNTLGDVLQTVFLDNYNYCDILKDMLIQIACDEYCPQNSPWVGCLISAALSHPDTSVVRQALAMIMYQKNAKFMPLLTGRNFPDELTKDVEEVINTLLNADNQVESDE